jgi:hypothetical protein
VGSYGPQSIFIVRAIGLLCATEKISRFRIGFVRFRNAGEFSSI